MGITAVFNTHDTLLQTYGIHELQYLIKKRASYSGHLRQIEAK